MKIPRVQRRGSKALGTVGGLSLLMILCGSQALWAANFPVTGQMRVRAPSAGAGNRVVTLPLSGSTLNQTGVAPMSITMAANLWKVTGTGFRIFPEFPNVAQMTSTFSDTHPTLMFAAGGGPGTISWCPKITGCGTFTQGTVAPALISITSGPNNFGGTFALARHVTGSVVFVPDPPPPPVSIAVQRIRPLPAWEGGLTAFRTLMNPPGYSPRIYASPSFGPQGSVIDVGVFVSTASPPNSLFATGFPMGTGMIFVIDATPPTPDGGPFSSSTTGRDDRTAAGNGNIVLVGGGVGFGGTTGNTFFRFNRISMTLPEPSGVAGLLAGVVALLCGARMRKRA